MSLGLVEIKQSLILLVMLLMTNSPNMLHVSIMIAVLLPKHKKSSRTISQQSKIASTPSMAKLTRKILSSCVCPLLQRMMMPLGLLYMFIAWQLANEPQQGPAWWFEEISTFMKKGAPKHLVSAGLESILDKYDFDRAHKHKNIDYTTCHLWVEK